MNIKQMNIAAWAALLIVGTFGALLMYGIAQGAFQASAGRLPVGVVCGLGVLAAVGMLLAYTLTFRMFGDHGAPDLPMSQLLPSTLKGFGICAAYRYAGNLWLPIGMHWGWNFAQGSIFGFSVSGTDGGASFIKPTFTGPQWLTGGEFGAEASVVAIVIGLALGLWFAVQAVRRQRQQPAQIGIATAES